MDRQINTCGNNSVSSLPLVVVGLGLGGGGLRYTSLHEQVVMFASHLQFY